MSYIKTTFLFLFCYSLSILSVESGSQKGSGTSTSHSDQVDRAAFFLENSEKHKKPVALCSKSAAECEALNLLVDQIADGLAAMKQKRKKGKQKKGKHGRRMSIIGLEQLDELLNNENGGSFE